MRSDTDCDAASESDTQTELKTPKKEFSPSPDVIVEECREANDLVSKYQKISLTNSGTVNTQFILLLQADYQHREAQTNKTSTNGLFMHVNVFFNLVGLGKLLEDCPTPQSNEGILQKTAKVSCVFLICVFISVWFLEV